jgi:phage shock protein PspC (stress-responsive transcriptional regulator)
MGRRVRAFLAFLYDFVIGDDWRIAVAVVAGLAVTYAVSQTTVPSWWVMPAVVVVLLPASLWRATRRR